MGATRGLRASGTTRATETDEGWQDQAGEDPEVRRPRGARRAGPSLTLHTQWLPALAVIALASGCKPGELSGTIRQGPPGGTTTGPQSPGPTEAKACVITAEPPPPQLRRLSGDQYRNTVRDLFGGVLGAEVASSSSFPETVITSGLATDASANNVNESESNQIEDNAASLATLIANRMTEVIPCVTDPSDAAQVDGCIDAFIADFGQRVYRRPLRDTERALIRGVYDVGRMDSAQLGFQSVIEFLLQSPALLYRVEYGAQPVPDAPGRYLLGDHELATRLSYFLWNSTPDAALTAAAAAGELATPEGLERHARRMVQDDRVLDALEPFHRDLMHTYRLDNVGLEEPGFTPAMRAAMRAELRQYLERNLRAGTLDFAGLFGSDRYDVPSVLASIYGVDDTTTEHRDPRRRGILGLASVMASMGADEGKNPTIVRAIFMLESILCQTLPAFPGNIDVDTELNETNQRATARDRLAPTTTNATCRGCHQGINPPGFALEQFDALGRYRTEENGAVIDASGEMGIPGASGTFSGSTEFLELIASSDRARSCYVDHWLQAAVGRPTATADICTVQALTSKWTEDQEDLRELLVQITLTEQFRQVEIQENE